MATNKVDRLDETVKTGLIQFCLKLSVWALTQEIRWSRSVCLQCKLQLSLLDHQALCCSPCTGLSDLVTCPSSSSTVEGGIELLFFVAGLIRGYTEVALSCESMMRLHCNVGNNASSYSTEQHNVLKEQFDIWEHLLFSSWKRDKRMGVNLRAVSWVINWSQDLIHLA